MSFYLVLNLGTAPSNYEQFRLYGVSTGLVISSRTNQRLATVWTASDDVSSKAQVKVLEEANIEVVVTSGLHDTGAAIEKFMP